MRAVVTRGSRTISLRLYENGKNFVSENLQHLRHRKKYLSLAYLQNFLFYSFIQRDIFLYYDFFLSFLSQTHFAGVCLPSHLYFDIISFVFSFFFHIWTVLVYHITINIFSFILMTTFYNFCLCHSRHHSQAECVVVSWWIFSTIN